MDLESYINQHINGKTAKYDAKKWARVASPDKRQVLANKLLKLKEKFEDVRGRKDNGHSNNK